MNAKHYTLRKHWLILLIGWIVLAAGVFPLQGQESYISNRMVNLSRIEGEKELESVTVDRQIEGNTIHLLWVEYEYNKPGKLYYRRSADLGETWDNPILIMTQSDSGELTGSEYRKSMAVSGNTVHIAVTDYNYADNGTGRLYYFRSDDNGVAFSEGTVIDMIDGYKRITNSQIRAMGEQVVIAYRKELYRASELYAAVSTDSGKNFKKNLVDKSSTETHATTLYDLHFDGSHIHVLHGYYSWYLGPGGGRVYMSTSADRGQIFSTKLLSGDITSCFEPWPSNRGDHYWPHVAKVGNTLHVIFERYEKASMYVRSDDNGATWTPPINLREADMTNNQSSHHTIIAKGDYVYVSYSYMGYHYLKISKDKGLSWKPSRRIMRQSPGNVTLYKLLPDPNDVTGKTFYVFGGCFDKAKSTNAGESFIDIATYPINFNSTPGKVNQLMIDGKGTEHLIASLAPISDYSQSDKIDLYYLRFGNQPAPGELNKAWHVKRDVDEPYQGMIVCGNSDFRPDKALTVEAWVNFKEGIYGAGNIFSRSQGYHTQGSFNLGIRTGSSYGNGFPTLYVRTDKGEVEMYKEERIDDTLWHHVAFTYEDHPDRLLNLKMYIDGEQVLEKELAGSLLADDDYMYVVGPDWFQNYKVDYWIDDVRMWSRALTAEEIKTNMRRKDFSGEEALELYLSFDDTFKDLSGNGNDGVPMMSVTFEETDRGNIPTAGFEVYKEGYEVTFGNRSENGISYEWDFGDKAPASVLKNPKHVYAKPGVYKVLLKTSNNVGRAASAQTVNITGVERIEPSSAGNMGLARISVFGGSFGKESVLFLRKPGEQDLPVMNPEFPEGGGVLGGFLDMSKAKTGKWDVVVKNGDTEYVLAEAFEVVEAEEPETWCALEGRDRILFNKWQTYTISYGNRGNVDAYIVPVYFAISDVEGLEVEYLDFVTVQPEELAVADIGKKMMNEMGDFSVVNDRIDGIHKTRIYPLVIPVIPGNSNGSIRIRIKSPGDVSIAVWSNPLWGQLGTLVTRSGESQGIVAAGTCFIEALGMAAIDGGLSVIPGVSCAWGALKIGWNWGNVFQGKETLFNAAWITGTSLGSCALSFSGVPFIYQLVSSLVIQGADMVKTGKDCMAKKGGGQKHVKAVSSFDPNEKIGPAGYGTEHWIRQPSDMSYSILFENKSSATAPAHTVTVHDTLDLGRFDLSQFGFGDFGFGGRTYSLKGDNLRSFAQDVDLRPGKELIIRVTGHLDEAKGVLRWNFLTLNPTTMEEEEDPDLGFLPPNKTAPEGEGFVSFRTGIKQGLRTGDVIANKASIVFDANPPIVTELFSNKIDETAPESKVVSVTAATGEPRWWMEWEGSDEGTGVIRSYELWVSKNNEPFTLWNVFPGTSVKELFAPELGASYRFYCISRDDVGNEQLGHEIFDAGQYTSIPSTEASSQALGVYPNPFKGTAFVRYPGLRGEGGCRLEVITLSGVRIRSVSCSAEDLRNGMALSVTDISAGCYVLVVRRENVLGRQIIFIE